MVDLDQLAFSEEVGVVVEVLISPGVKRNIIVVVMLKFQKHCDQGNTKAWRLNKNLHMLQTAEGSHCGSFGAPWLDFVGHGRWLPVGMVQALQSTRHDLSKPCHAEREFMKHDICIAGIEMKNTVMIGGDTFLWISADSVSKGASLYTLSNFTWVSVNMYFVQWGWWTQETSGLHCQPHALLSSVFEECCQNLNGGIQDKIHNRNCPGYHIGISIMMRHSHSPKRVPKFFLVGRGWWGGVEKGAAWGAPSNQVKNYKHDVQSGVFHPWTDQPG